MKPLVFLFASIISIGSLAYEHHNPATSTLSSDWISIQNEKKHYSNHPNFYTYQVFTVDSLRTIQNAKSCIIYRTKNNSDGLWKYDADDDSTADNTGTVLVLQDGSRLKRIFDAAKGVNIEWFGGSGDGKTDNAPAFERAKEALPDGGIINFGKGVYTSNKNWMINQSNIFLKGAGTDKTVITAAESVGRTFNICPIREIDSLFTQGQKGDANALFPFLNSIKKGDNYIDLKSAAWSDEFPVGQEIFIRAGANYYDQEFGELNVIEKKQGARLYLKYPLSRDYSYEKENWFGILLQDFTPPPVGQTAIAVVKNPPKRINFPFSLGNDIYTLIAVNGNTITLKNPGRGNSTNTIKAGTYITKGRQIIKSFHTRNFSMEGITILGKQTRVFAANNSYNTLIKNCVIIRDPIKQTPGPFTFTVDCTRGVTFDNVTFIAKGVISSGQISRSSGDVTFKNCHFENVSTDFSEFCFNVLVDSCSYNIHTGQFATRLGKSTTFCKVTNSSFIADSIGAVVSMDDIQGYKNSQREGCLVQKCSFDLNNCNVVLQNMGGGINTFGNNTIKGNFSAICVTLRMGIPVNNPDKPNDLIIKNNTVTANIKGALFNAGNATIENNSFTYVGKASTLLSAGVIIRKQSSDTAVIKNLVLRNNHFINWIKEKDVIGVTNMKRPNNSVDISGNTFN